MLLFDYRPCATIYILFPVFTICANNTLFMSFRPLFMIPKYPKSRRYEMAWRFVQQRICSKIDAHPHQHYYDILHITLHYLIIATFFVNLILCCLCCCSCGTGLVADGTNCFVSLSRRALRLWKLNYREDTRGLWAGLKLLLGWEKGKKLEKTADNKQTGKPGSTE